jgi:hypothetical protein
MDLKILVKVKQLQTSAFTKMPFKVSKASLHASSHSQVLDDFFKRFVKGVVILAKFLMNL